MIVNSGLLKEGYLEQNSLSLRPELGSFVLSISFQTGFLILIESEILMNS